MIPVIDCSPSYRALLASLACLIGSLFCCTPIEAQPPIDPRDTRSVANDATFTDPEVPIFDAAEIQSVMNESVSETTPAPSAPSGIDLLELMTLGGAFMFPIGLMSLLVVALAFERLVSLRYQRILPRRLARELKELRVPVERFDPSAAFAACQKHPSPAARVVTAMLRRTGQPLAEIEQAAKDTIEREVEQCGASIRWLTLAAAATPLLGLLGTVWGMIIAFHESTVLTPDRSRSEQLSEGIYIALVTTLAGLIVAIPATILALYFENRLAKLFHRLEEFVFELSPAFVRFTGHRRLDQEGVLHPMGVPFPAVEAPKPPSPPRTAKQHDGLKAV